MTTTINLTPILQAILGLLAALVTYRLVPWIKAKTSSEKQRQLQAAIRVAIFAAEQVYGAGHGDEKKDYAIKWLHEQGWDVDGRAIEGAVGEFINALGWDVEDEVTE